MVVREGMNTQRLKQPQDLFVTFPEPDTVTPCGGDCNKYSFCGNTAWHKPLGWLFLSLVVLSGGLWYSERSCLGNKQLNNQREKRPGESSFRKTSIPALGSARVMDVSVPPLFSNTSFCTWNLRVTFTCFWSDLRSGASVGVWLEALLLGWVTSVWTVCFIIALFTPALAEHNLIFHASNKCNWERIDLHTDT